MYTMHYFVFKSDDQEKYQIMNNNVRKLNE